MREKNKIKQGNSIFLHSEHFLKTSGSDEKIIIVTNLERDVERDLEPEEERERDLEPVLRIHDILGWIQMRIWIRGSMPLTNGSGSCYFRH